VEDFNPEFTEFLKRAKEVANNPKDKEKARNGEHSKIEKTLVGVYGGGSLTLMMCLWCVYLEFVIISTPLVFIQVLCQSLSFYSMFTKPDFNDNAHNVSKHVKDEAKY